MSQLQLVVSPIEGGANLFRHEMEYKKEEKLGYGARVRQ